MSGFTSISVISGWSAEMRASARTASVSAARSTGSKSQKRAGSGPDRLVTAQAERNQSALRLVADAGACSLDGYWAIEAPGDSHGLVLVAREVTLRDGDPVVGEQRLGLPLIRSGDPLSDCRRHDLG